MATKGRFSLCYADIVAMLPSTSKTHGTKWMSWTVVLCVAKDETSVDIMCSRFVVISCEKSIMTNLAGETIDARCVDCVYMYIYIYIYIYSYDR
jgi:hypothetical protein